MFTKLGIPEAGGRMEGTYNPNYKYKDNSCGGKMYQNASFSPALMSRETEAQEVKG